MTYEKHEHNKPLADPLSTYNHMLAMEHVNAPFDRGTMEWWQLGTGTSPQPTGAELVAIHKTCHYETKPPKKIRAAVRR